jgi:ribosomal protein S18 acetylase RimI-like enzyme
MAEDPVGTIRQARAEDADRCGEIAGLAWKRVFDSWLALIGPELFDNHYTGWKERQSGACAEAVREHPERAIVTEVDGEIVGFLTWYLPGPPGVGEIGGNAVHPDWQGRGIGVGQCRRALDIFREMGLTSATVYTGLDEGHAPARTMYTRAGFNVSTPHIRYFLKL